MNLNFIFVYDYLLKKYLIRILKVSLVFENYVPNKQIK